VEEGFSAMQGPVYIGANMAYLKEAAAILHSRMISSGIAIYCLMEDLGDDAAMITALQDGPVINVWDKGPTDEQVIASFYMKLALLVKFLYPTMEQLYASVETHVEFKSSEDA
jgi:hypothetical protein